MIDLRVIAMADSSPSFFRRHWEGWKDYWGERFAILDNYAKFVNRDKPIPKWSDSDVEEFIASDPVYGPTLRTTREAAKFAVAGAVIGAVSTAAVSWKYSRSPHGAVLSFAAGGVFGVTFGQEFASHWLQLYRLDTLGAEVKFLEWWERKIGGRS